MKKVNYFDVHDRDVPAVVYQLMFATVDIEGNDRIYEINPEDMLERVTDEDHSNYLENGWAERFKRGPSNCYYDNKAMQDLHKNWPTIKEAVLRFHEWLKSHDINPKEDLIVKVWW